MSSSRALRWQSALDTVTMADGRRLHCNTFAPNTPRAVAVFAPATGLDVNVYVPLVVSIARTGVLVVLPLPREDEHGRTAAALRHADDLLALTDATRREHPQLPLFLGAHSAGCSVAWRALCERSDDVDGVFLIAPRSIGRGSARRLFRADAAPGPLAAAWHRCRNGWKAMCGMQCDACDTPASQPLGRQLPVFVAVSEDDNHAPPHANASALRAAFCDAPDCTIVTMQGAGDVGVLQPAAKAVSRWLASQLAVQPSYAA